MSRATAGSRRDRSVAAVLTTVFATSAATFALTTVLGKQVYDLTGRELDLGLLGLAEFLPAAVLVLVTGGVADRYDRRWVASISCLGAAATAGGMAWYAGSEPTSATPIFLLVLAFGVCRAFLQPAARSLPADMMAPERLPWLVARASFTSQAATVVGPVLGGTLYAVDIGLPYTASAFLFVASSVAVLRLRIAPVEKPPPPLPGPAAVEPGREDGQDAGRSGAGWASAVEGLRFIRREPILLGALSLDMFAVLFGGAIALLPAIATDRLGVDSVGLGWLRAAGGIGAGLVLAGLAFRPITRRVGRTLLLAVTAFGAGTIVLGVTRSFAVALVAMAALSGADAISMFIRKTLVPLVTPREKRGRVLAVEGVFLGGSNELGAFESGVAGQLVGPSAAIVFGGVATMAIAGAWWVHFPALRDVDEFPVGVNAVPSPDTAPAPPLSPVALAGADGRSRGEGASR
jgi:MFS family permease